MTDFPSPTDHAAAPDRARASDARTEHVAVLPREPAPLRPIDRGWLDRWSEQLDARRHPSVSGSASVGAILRHVFADRGDDVAAPPASRLAVPSARSTAAEG